MIANNYGNWFSKLEGDAGTPQQKLDALAQNYRHVALTEFWEADGITARSLKERNAAMRVYRLWDLVVKNTWDGDWLHGEHGDKMQTPLAHDEIDAADWWLRDGEGEIVKESEDTWFLDPGKAGFRDAYADACLTRLAGRGFDGVCFDYWHYGLSWLLGGRPRPAAYATDADWFNLAWQPFISHVCGALRSAGYRIIGNSAGEYTDTRPEVLFQRAWCDGTVYEQFAFDYEGQPQPLGRLQSLLQCLAEDPLEVWVAELGIRDSLATRTPRNRALSLAAYYVGLPVAQTVIAPRSYHYYGSGDIFWDPYWDIYLGWLGPCVQQSPGLWLRFCSAGMVALNCSGSTQEVPLRRTMVDQDGRTWRTRLRLPSGAGALLRESRRG